VSSNDIIYQSKGALIAFLVSEGFQTGSDTGNITGSALDNEIAVWSNPTTIEGDANFTWDNTLRVTGAFFVSGDATLGDASGDTVTINAQTIDLANVAAGTDNTVLIFNGSTVLTDEIDSKVWAGNLIDYTGTPVDNQLAIWTDTDTLEGDSNLTWDGSTLDVGGALTVDGNATLGNASSDLHTVTGYLTLPTGLSSSMGTQISSAANTTAADYWIKVAEARCSVSSYRASATIDVMLAGYEVTTEIYQARVYLSYYAGAVATCQVDIIQDEGYISWDTSDFILTYDASSDMAQLWVRDPAQYQRCYATITNGSSDGNMHYKSDWYLKTGQSWASSYVSLGAEATTINVKKRFDSLGIDGDLQVTGSVVAPNIGTDTGNDVVILNSSGYLKTDEIDSRVWGSTLVDGTNGTDNELAIFTDSNSVEGDSNLTWNGSTLDVGGALTVDGNTTLGDAYTDTVTIQAATTTLTPTGNNLPQLKLESKNGTADNAGEIRFERYDDAVIAAGESLGEILFDATETDNGTYYSAATITGEVGTGTWTDASSHPGAIRFWTCADSGTTLTERMSIESDGTVALNGDLTVATAGSTIAQESWTAVSYGSGWADYSVAYLGVSYMKDSLGFIHIRGMAKKTSGTADLVFTLPAGYRPANRLIFSAQAYDYGTGYTYGRVDVQTDGKVTVENPGTLAVGDWVSFGAINFDTRAEP